MPTPSLKSSLNANVGRSPTPVSIPLLCNKVLLLLYNKVLFVVPQGFKSTVIGMLCAFLILDAQKS